MSGYEPAVFDLVDRIKKGAFPDVDMGHVFNRFLYHFHENGESPKMAVAAVTMEFTVDGGGRLPLVGEAVAVAESEPDESYVDDVADLEPFEFDDLYFGSEVEVMLSDDNSDLELGRVDLELVITKPSWVDWSALLVDDNER